MPEAILIVDDEASVTLPLEGFFEQRGYRVLKAFYGDQALEQIQRHRPQLVVLDLQMPGVDGIAVLEQIRRDVPGTKVAVITGHIDRYREDLDRLHPEAILVKPVSVGELARTVESLLKAMRVSKEPESPKPPATEKEIRVLFLETDDGLYEDAILPYFQHPESQRTYRLDRAVQAEDAFEKIKSFRPHWVVVDMERIPFGLDGGRLAAQLIEASGGTVDVALHAFPRKKPYEDIQAQLRSLDRTMARQEERTHRVEEGLRGNGSQCDRVK
jgi:CheY-like chemotaxis protein